MYGQEIINTHITYTFLFKYFLKINSYKVLKNWKLKTVIFAHLYPGHQLKKSFKIKITINQ